MKQKIKGFFMRVWGDFSLRTLLFLYGGGIFNALYAVLYIVFSLALDNEMLFAFSVYYTVLAVNRLFLIRSYRLSERGKEKNPWRIFLHSGMFVFALGLSLFPLSAFLILKERSTHYSLPLLLASLAYTLSVLFLSTRGSIRHTESGSPILSAAKNISLSGALVSLLSLGSVLPVSYTLLATFSAVATLSIGVFMMVYGRSNVKGAP